MITSDIPTNANDQIAEWESPAHIAYAKMALRTGHELLASIQNGKMLAIMSYYVEPQYIVLSRLAAKPGSGHGSMLVQELQQLASRQQLPIHVQAERSLTNFYRKFGFEITTEHEPHTAVWMTWYPNDQLRIADLVEE